MYATAIAMLATRIDIYYLQIQNYELGILFLLKDEQEVDRIACFERPPRKYSANDLPWVSQQDFKSAVTYRILVCATLDARGIFCTRFLMITIVFGLFIISKNS
jgi:hypothetical protein